MSSPRPRPLVSVVIDSHQHERFVGDAITSALAQRYEPLEVIVVDDGSTDRSRVIIRGFGDRIVPIFTDNRGQASAFNIGFAASRGDVVCLLDSDDLAHPERAASVVRALGADEELGFCFHPLEILGPNEQPQFAPVTAHTWRPIDVRDAVRRGERIPYRAPATSGLAFRRALLGRVLPMTTNLRISADNYMKLVALGISRGVVLPERLGAQRLHGANLYTGRPRYEAERARIAVEVAAAVRAAHPEIGRGPDRVFLRAAGKLLGLSGVGSVASNPVVRRYAGALRGRDLLFGSHHVVRQAISGWLERPRGARAITEE